MAVSIVHAHVSAIANDPTKDVSSTRWNEAHTVVGLGTAAEADTGDFATAAQGALADTAIQAADLATVATTGAYADLSGKPTLGTMAAESAGDYSTTAAIALAYQPLDTQLTSVAGLSYGSNALKVVRVNAGENAFELATITAGDASGPASSTDNAIARFDGTTGKLLQNSSAFVTDTGHVQSGTDGNTTTVSFGRSANANTGMYFSGGNQISFAANGVSVVTWGATTASWNSAVTHNGLRFKVAAKTNGSGSPYSIDTTNDGNSCLTNEGASAKVYMNLPGAAAGYFFDFVVQDTDGLRIVPAAGDNIRIEASVSTTGTSGYIESTTQGSTLRLQAINATEWVAMFYTGTWATA